MADSAFKGGPVSGEPALLGIYLNDHLAAGTGGLALFQRCATAHRGTAVEGTLTGLAAEIAEDRRALIDMMKALSVSIRHYKMYAGWAVEKLGRLKPNGHLTSRSPLSTLLELESMLVGVEGKAALWRTLRRLAEEDQRLESSRLDSLLERARRQSDTLEGLRAGAATEVFSGR